MIISTIPAVGQLREATSLILLPILDEATLADHYSALLPDDLLTHLQQKPLKVLRKGYELLLPSGTTLLFFGPNGDHSFQDFLKAARRLAHHHAAHWPQRVGLGVPTDFSPYFLEACINGLLLGTYQIGRFKTADTTDYPFGGPDSELFVGGASDAMKPAIESARALATTQLRIFDLVNAPSNYKRPQDIAEWVEAAGAEVGFDVEIWDKERCAKEGFGGLLAVNSGSPDPACFIQMRHRGAKTEQPVVLVGKGVTFDTGGVSIKPSNNMHLMKSDMGGAAAVIGTIEAAARLRLPIDLVGLVPVTDNSVDAKAVKPSDVITSYSGKTIEIIDTDAEGRLILADGLHYAVKHYQPSILIDLATLTGSAVRALGYAAGALFSKDDQLAASLLQSGQHCGEKLWRLPLWEEYGEAMKSDIADIRNLSGKPIAGAITAAKFLEFFTDDHPRWAHMDIAGVALSASEYAKDRSATAFGIRLLITYLESLVE